MVSAAHHLVVAITLAVAFPIHAFTSTSSSIGCAGSTRGHYQLGATTDDAAAQALSDYMSKSHEEKLRAIKAVEDKKNAEIETLKSEIQQLKTSSALATTSPAAPQPLANIPSSELEAKLASYQSFMAEYIVNSQNEKLLAVKEAELKAEKKFQERLEKLFEASGMKLPADSSTAAASGDSAVDSGGGGESLFQKRNAYIIQAANAGLSRWGSKEIERAIEQAKSAPTIVLSSSTAPATSSTSAVNASPFDMRNAQIVAAANAGVSRWGEKEVERAKINGATATTSPTPATAPITLEDRINLGSGTAFESRNVQVVASAAAGKSRWGDKEVERAMESNGATVTTAPPTTAISLDDRVNLGARLLGAK